MSAEKGACKPRPRTSATTHTLATQAAGALSTILLYPMDVVRMRFMSQDGTLQRQHNGQTYSFIWRAMRTVWREEGLRALFRGCHVAVLGAVSAWGVYMYLYRALCTAWESVSPQNDNVLDFMSSVLVSTMASTTSAIVCTPIWLMKTRMQLVEVSASLLSSYSSFYRGIIFAVENDGFLSLWRGASAQILLGIPNALNFPVYDFLKAYTLRLTQQDSLSTPEVCACSTVSKTIVMLFAHPIHLIKTRLQDHRSRLGDVHYVSLVQSISTTIRRNGWKGMYRGAVPSLVLSVPRCVITFVLYEQFLRIFLSHQR